MKKRTFLVAACLMMLLFPGSGFSAYIINSVTDHTISGSEMDGLLVTFVFDGQLGTQTFSWAATGATSGQAGIQPSGGPFFFLSQMGDTYGSLSSEHWSLYNYSGFDLLSLKLEGWNAGIVFDTKDGTMPGDEFTPGSNLGHISPSTGAVTFTPSDQVFYQVSTSPYNDLWATVVLDFGSGLATGTSLTFRLDTDKVTPVPEPASLLLLGSGLLGLMGVKKKSDKRHGRG